MSINWREDNREFSMVSFVFASWSTKPNGLYRHILYCIYTPDKNKNISSLELKDVFAKNMEDVSRYFWKYYATNYWIILTIHWSKIHKSIYHMIHEIWSVPYDILWTISYVVDSTASCSSFSVNLLTENNCWPKFLGNFVCIFLKKKVILCSEFQQLKVLIHRVFQS